MLSILHFLSLIPQIEPRPSFGDLTPYLSTNVNQDLGSGKNFTDFSLTPGIRFFVGWHTYFITGVIVPVTNPKSFNPGLTAVVSRGW